MTVKDWPEDGATHFSMTIDSCETKIGEICNISNTSNWAFKWFVVKVGQSVVTVCLRSIASQRLTFFPLSSCAFSTQSRGRGVQRNVVMVTEKSPGWPWVRQTWWRTVLFKLFHDLVLQLQDISLRFPPDENDAVKRLYVLQGLSSMGNGLFED